MNTTSSAYTSTWQSPSNLAIVKYWGKKELQQPINPSVSFSLSKAVTTTTVSLTPTKSSGFSFYLNNEEKPAFRPKIQKFLDRIRSRIPLIDQFHLNIYSSNTFPHSSGIASSASAMSALAFCLADLQQQVAGEKNLSIQEVSYLSRIGSGSAARSVYGGWNLWGHLPEIPESSDFHAIPLPIKIHPLFKTLQDDILIVSDQRKKVSSTAGHALMHDHPFRNGRIKQAHNNTLLLLKHLENGNWEGFSTIAENEAMSLHGLMMSSHPSFTLMLPATLSLINEIKEFQQNSGLPVTFTLDAGPNIHLLYPQNVKKEIVKWENQKLKPLCEKGTIIHDHIGDGPQKISQQK
ncbi:diphosphomevalonate/mevalonate 3,5-bisphosphate decarboxylase family protein [Thermophagus sp. OGC60D27]|uniref:diphosphomevalonate/mevalonate 3,5-bisphosphate decarboxylase family protein n=1 Tax=Thermophagus sp. OGC60D27 TaxID=3458415 RepID=UPI004037C831